MLQAAPPGSVIAGMTAAMLHRLWLPPGGCGPIEVVLRIDAPVPRRHAGSRRVEVRGRRRSIHSDEVVLVDGLRVTSEARTWIDLAERLSIADLIAAGDSVLRGHTSREDLDRVLRRAAHRRGVVRARTAFPLLDAASRSRPESHLRYALVSGGLPAPAVNKAIYSPAGEWLAEPDLHYLEARLAIEYNGALHSDVTRMRRDITRDIDVAHRGGWRSITLGPAEVFGRPDQVAAFVRELYRERTQYLRGTPRPASPH